MAINEYKPMEIKFNIFISHDKSDETIALELKEFLENIFLNSNVYVSGRDIKGGQTWIENIKMSLKTSQVIIAIISNKSLKSEWLHFETGAGFVEDKSIPLIVGDMTFNDLNPPLSLLQGRQLTKDGISKLINDISNKLNQRIPNSLNGVDKLIQVSENFLKLRNEEELIVKPTVKNVPSVKNTTTTSSDTEIQNKFDSANERLLSLLKRKILSYKNISDLPSENELNELTRAQLFDVASAFNIPSPNFARLELTTLGLDLPKSDAKVWEKMNALKSIESAHLEMDKFEKLI